MVNQDVEDANMNCDKPNWEPLKRRIGAEAKDWMWMCEDVAAGIHCYKHSLTRVSIHLNDKGDCFDFIDEGIYVPSDFDAAMKEHNARYLEIVQEITRWEIEQGLTLVH